MIKSVKVTGVKEATKNIEKFKRSMLDELEDSADAGANAIAAMVRSNAPGSIKEGVATKRLPRKQGKPAVTMVGIKWWGYQHVHLIEFGTRPRYYEGAYRGIMPEGPFFRPSVDASRGAVKNVLISGATKAMRRAGK